MGIRFRVAACFCAAVTLGAMVVGEGVRAGTSWDTTITSGRVVGCHEAPCPDDVEGVVGAERGASKRCVGGRTIQIVEQDTGRVVGVGVTSRDGSFRIPSDDTTFRLIAQVLERRAGRRGQNVCACASTEVSLFVE
jgi:hypothetical protein